MKKTPSLTESIINGIQNKKGKKITIVSLGELSSLCDEFIICQGNSPTQVSALSDSIEETVRKETGDHAVAFDGKAGSEWIAIDYGSVIVHIFTPELRSFYDIEHLWNDAKVTAVPDID